MVSYALTSNERVARATANAHSTGKGCSFNPGSRPVIQTKLSVNQPGDAYEREADNIADRVVSMSAPGVQAPSSHVEVLQRKCAHCEEEEKLQQKPLDVRLKAFAEAASSPVQLLQRKCAHCEEEEKLQRKPLDLQPKPFMQSASSPVELVQRKCPHCEEEEKLRQKSRDVRLKPFIQAKSDEGGIASDAVSSKIQSTKGGGSPMSESTRDFMESRFDTDFSQVRIHTGDYAVQMSADLNAQAFTVGNDIYFNSGKFAPGSADGQRLLAHELVHTVQQGGRVGRKIQRDLAIEPQVPGAAGRALTAADMTKAIEDNRKEFSDPYSIMTIRDVVGIPKYPAVVDEDFVNGVLQWQANHGINQDGIVGRITGMYIMEELQAEGQTRDADLLRQEFEGGRTIDIDTSLCGCKDRLRHAISSSLTVRSDYELCRVDPAVLTGPQVQQCVIDAVTASGATPVVAGTTSPSGQIAVNPQAGSCGALMERITLAHEQIHQTHVRDLEQSTGSKKGEAPFDATFNDKEDWARDEIAAHTSDINVSRWALGILDSICP